jgi:hypothetical protein
MTLDPLGEIDARLALALAHLVVIRRERRRALALGAPVAALCGVMLPLCAYWASQDPSAPFVALHIVLGAVNGRQAWRGATGLRRDLAELHRMRVGAQLDIARLLADRQRGALAPNPTEKP